MHLNHHIRKLSLKDTDEPMVTWPKTGSAHYKADSHFLIAYLLCAGHWAESLLQPSEIGAVLLPFIGKETEAQGGLLTCLSCISVWLSCDMNSSRPVWVHILHLKGSSRGREVQVLAPTMTLGQASFLGDLLFSLWFALIAVSPCGMRQHPPSSQLISQHGGTTQEMRVYNERKRKEMFKKPFWVAKWN